MSTTTDTRPIICPFTVAVDTREQIPYSFTGFQSDAKTNNRPLTIHTQQTTLSAGDYSIVGLTDRIAIERKSLADLYSTCGHGIDRFRREHERLAEYDQAFVVIEASWDTVRFHPPKRSRMNPQAITKMATKWGIRYGVQWMFLGIDRHAPYQVITDHGLDVIAKDVDVAFFSQESHAERVAKVVEAYRAKYSRVVCERLTFQLLNDYWEVLKEKEKKDEHSTNTNANAKHAKDSRTGRSERIGDNGGRRGPKLGQPGHDPELWTPSGKPIDDIPF